MAVINLQTKINAPVERCFDLARSIDVHMVSTSHTGERAIAGRTSGLIEKGERVTWRAKHLGVWQNLTSIIPELDYPYFFVDEMVEGAFKSFMHEHHFKFNNGVTEMIDIFTFQSPAGIIGELVNKFLLNQYMTRLLEKRNNTIKEYAESDKWKLVLVQS